MAAIADNFIPATVAEVGTVTFSGTATVSDALDLDDRNSIVGLITTSDWNAATIGLQVSMDNSTFVALYDSSAIFATGTYTGAVGVAINPQLTAGWKYVKVTASANQINDTVQVVKRPV